MTPTSKPLGDGADERIVQIAARVADAAVQEAWWRELPSGVTDAKKRTFIDGAKFGATKALEEIAALPQPAGDEVEAAAQAILAKVPVGYGMSFAEAREYARAALASHKPAATSKPACGDEVEAAAAALYHAAEFAGHVAYIEEVRDSPGTREIAKQNQKKYETAADALASRKPAAEREREIRREQHATTLSLVRKTLKIELADQSIAFQAIDALRSLLSAEPEPAAERDGAIRECVATVEATMQRNNTPAHILADLRALLSNSGDRT